MRAKTKIKQQININLHCFSYLFVVISVNSSIFVEKYGLIMAFSEEMIAELTSEKRNLLEQLKGYEQIQKRIEAIDVLLASTSPNRSSSQEVKQRPEASFKEELSGYDKHWVWDDKCLFVIHQLGGMAYTPQVVEELLKLEPDLRGEETKVYTKTAYSLSHMYRSGKIKVRGQSGRKYKYSLQ